MYTRLLKKPQLRLGHGQKCTENMPRAAKRVAIRCLHGYYVCCICGGSRKPPNRTLCIHQTDLYYCFECGGAAFCHHGVRVRWCVDCGGSGLCDHGVRKASCVKCHPSLLMTRAARIAEARFEVHSTEMDFESRNYFVNLKALAVHFGIDCGAIGPTLCPFFGLTTGPENSNNYCRGLYTTASAIIACRTRQVVRTCSKPSSW